jgi:N-acetyl-anhydromuramyl-L-alanine amidase AmpD
MRTIKKLIVHCSDSDDSLDIGFREIDEWHRQRGWLSPSGISCGYHFIIRRFGKIDLGRPLDEIGAHCKGQNSDSIGICVVGRKKFDPVQLDVLMKKINDLRKQYNIPVEKVFGHYEFEPNKTCPNMDMVRLRAELLFVK